MTHTAMLPRFLTANVIGAVLLGLIGALSWSLAGGGFLKVDSPFGEGLVTIYLFAAQDGPIMIGALAVLLSGLVAMRFPWGDGLVENIGRSRGALVALLLLGFGASLFTRVVLHQSFGLSLDEYMPEFQAGIFRSGNLLQVLPAAEFSDTENFQRFFTWTHAPEQVWGSHYRPMHAAMIALIGADLLNPLMAVVTLWAMADIARRLFPDQIEAAFVAAALLLVSPQFLATNGSGFAFATHLALNMVWLALFLRGGFGHHCLAALVGALAIGLHQVHVHPLFAAPFLVALLWGAFGSRIKTLPYFVIYGIALPVWVLWPELATFLQTGDATVLPRRIMDVDYIRNYINFAETTAAPQAGIVNLLTGVNISRFAAWISPLVLVGVIAAVMMWRHQSLIIRLCLISFLLTVGFCHLVMPNQMHSWGARYFHPVLGVLILVAVSGYCGLRRAIGIGAWRWMLTGLVASMVILLPWRAYQIDAKVGPRAAVQAALAKIDADYVILPAGDIWFGYDMLRNHADLSNRPRLIFRAPPLRTPGTIRVLTAEDLYQMGLPRGSLLEPG